LLRSPRDMILTFSSIKWYSTYCTRLWYCFLYRNALKTVILFQKILYCQGLKNLFGRIEIPWEG
jgi:hypothetical protein